MDLVGRLTDLKGAYKQFAQFQGHARGIIKVGAGPSRRDDIVAECRKAIDSKALARQDAFPLDGQIRFLREGCFGRCGARALREIGAHAKSPAGRLGSQLVVALEWLVEYLGAAPPRQILCSAVDTPLLLFTDGACEANGVTVGAILLEEGFAPEAFGAVVPDKVVAAWRGP